MADSTAAAAAPAAAPQAPRPAKPDQEVYDKEVAQAEKEYKEALERYVSRLTLCALAVPPLFFCLSLLSISYPPIPLGGIHKEHNNHRTGKQLWLLLTCLSTHIECDQGQD